MTGVRSTLQLKLWIHVRMISQDSLFRPSTSMEAVQATSECLVLYVIMVFLFVSLMAHNKHTVFVSLHTMSVTCAAWNDAGWLLGGHAVRLAFEVGCHSAFLKLAFTGMGADKTPQQLEEDRPLVVMARVWYALVSIDDSPSVFLSVSFLSLHILASFHLSDHILVYETVHCRASDELW